jgi:hypothetical protein
VDGRLSHEEIDELESLIGGDPFAVGLELCDLRSADAAGLVALRRFRDLGVSMRGLSPHLALRIDDESDGSPERD